MKCNVLPLCVLGSVLVSFFSNAQNDDSFADGIYYCTEEDSILKTMDFSTSKYTFARLTPAKLKVKLKDNVFILEDEEIFHPIAKKLMNYDYKIEDGKNTEKVTVFLNNSGFVAWNIQQSFSMKFQDGKITFEQHNDRAYKVHDEQMQVGMNMSFGFCDKW